MAQQQDNQEIKPDLMDDTVGQDQSNQGQDQSSGDQSQTGGDQNSTDPQNQFNNSTEQQPS